MEALLLKVYNSKKATLSLRIISSLSVIISVLSYCALLFLSFYNSIPEGLAVLLSCAVPFFIVGFVRMKINAPRPYELYDFYLVKPKERSGRSFPSRHAYSVFVIAVVAFAYSVPLGAALLTLGVCLSVSRVLLGIHFPRDVITGGLIGVLAGLIGLFSVILPCT